MSDALPLSYATLSNLPLFEEQYARFQVDPESVDPQWRAFFDGVEFGSFQEEGARLEEASKDQRIFDLVDAYRRFGHLQAKINPVAMRDPEPVGELSLETLGFKTLELDELFPTAGLLEAPQAPLREIIAVLEEIYCRSVGVEYMGYQTPELEKWVQQQIEPTRFRPQLDRETKREILDQLGRAELFETFLHTKYVGQKRFSLEGGETLIPILHEAIGFGSTLGMEEFVMGMAHRGRLNVLANIMQKSYSMIFSEFEDFYDPSLTESFGDVKYHKGYSAEVTSRSGKQVHLALAANPSHLEAVDPVVEGATRAKQVRRGDKERERVVPVLIHGDASVAGQGVVYETMQLYRLAGYSTGGTIHIVVNNQIGFTTLPHDSRSTRYCTAIARSFSAPVFHVNAEDPEGCIFATRLAVQLRQKFHCDVFIDLNCYRKYGHNEGDEPAFTQPLEYQKIRKKQTIRELYRDQLIQEGAIERAIAQELDEKFRGALHHELEELKLKKEVSRPEAFGGIWEGFQTASKAELLEPVDTRVDGRLLQELTEIFTTPPSGFHLHQKVERLQKDRREMVEQGRIDWGMGEHLAFASLLWEGTPIRLSGQDSRRGTFSHRHAMWVDQENDRRYFPLAHLKEGQGRFDVYNSPLSEYAALGFEFGYSLSSPASLVLWEAQFGDFANGAQIIFDQFIAACEQKWMRSSGLTVLLPHGYEGQGSEHSSARIERFLQLAGGANWLVVYPTTPAQYFHLLRRQIVRNVRKPLIVFTPKGLLRHPQCVSTLEDLSGGRFEEVLDDPTPPKKASRLILCTGRIYYDLLKAREELGRDDVALVRIEQLYPCKKTRLQELMHTYNPPEIFWVQEEPRNMGAWKSLYPILLQLKPEAAKFQFVGRGPSGTTATGSHTVHANEQKQLMEMAFK